MSPLPNIVLAHSAWADGSGWGTVIERLRYIQVDAPEEIIAATNDWWPGQPPDGSQLAGG